MLPSGFIRKLLLVLFVIRTAAQQRPTAQQSPPPPQITQRQPSHSVDADDFQTIRHLPPIAILPFEPIYLQKSVTTNADDDDDDVAEAGNGNALTVLDNPPETMASIIYTESGQNPVNWFTIWLQEEQQRQRQKQKQKQRANFPNQNVALPFARDNNRNTKFKFQTNGIDDNSYPRGDGNGCEDCESKGVNYEEDEEEVEVQDSADEIQAAAAGRKDRIGWHKLAASNYAQPKNLPQPQLYSSHNAVKRVNWRGYKREKTHPVRNAFLPSISAGAMTNLGDFFRDLSKNLRFTEKSQLGQDELKLLEGNHPLGVLHEEWAKIAGAGVGVDKPTTEATDRKTEDFLHAIVNYRPSQKIRSLVAMNPRGYHGSQFIDPNYMWVGLGK